MDVGVLRVGMDLHVEAVCNNEAGPLLPAPPLDWLSENGSDHGYPEALARSPAAVSDPMFAGAFEDMSGVTAALTAAAMYRDDEAKTLLHSESWASELSALTAEQDDIGVDAAPSPLSTPPRSTRFASFAADTQKRLVHVVGVEGPSAFTKRPRSMSSPAGVSLVSGSISDSSTSSTSTASSSSSTSERLVAKKRGRAGGRPRAASASASAAASVEVDADMPRGKRERRSTKPFRANVPLAELGELKFVRSNDKVPRYGRVVPCSEGKFEAGYTHGGEEATRAFSTEKAAKKWLEQQRAALKLPLPPSDDSEAASYKGVHRSLHRDKPATYTVRIHLSEPQRENLPAAGLKDNASGSRTVGRFDDPKVAAMIFDAISRVHHHLGAVCFVHVLRDVSLGHARICNATRPADELLRVVVETLTTKDLLNADSRKFVTRLVGAWPGKPVDIRDLKL